MMRDTIFLLALAAFFACHREELVQVPDVTGQPTFVVDAMRRVQSSGFRTELHLQQNETIAPGFVVDESPRTPQPRGATITLTVAARTTQTADVPPSDQQELSDATAKRLERFFRQQIKIALPAVANMQVVPAIKQLQAFGFRVTLGVNVNAYQGSGVISGQIPAANTELPWGSNVSVFATATQPYDPQLSEDDSIRLRPVAEQRLTAAFAAMPPANNLILLQGIEFHAATHT